MPEPHEFLQNLALVLSVAALAAVLFHALRLPVVFGYLVAGMVVGPYLPIPLVADPKLVRALSELGVILLMYSLGLEFRLRRVADVAATAGPAALAETTVMFGLGYAFGAFAGWTPLESLFTGAMIAISSTTIIAKTFGDVGIAPRLKEIVFGVLIVEDLIAILLIAILSAVATGGTITLASLGVTGVRLASFLVAIIGIGLVVLPRVMTRVVAIGRDEMTTLAAIGVCFAAALLALAFGYSVALGAFIAGSLVAESGHGDRIAHRIEPVRDVFVAIFFVSVGMLIDPSVVALHWVAILALSATVVVGKLLAASLGVFAAGYGVRDGVRAGMSLAQIGEFSFIIAGVGLAAGAIRPFLYPVAVAVSAITTLLTPWLVRAADPAAAWVDRRLPRALQTYAALYGSWIERLRAGGGGADDRAALRRLVRLVAIDVALLMGLVIATGAEVGRLGVMVQEWFDWTAVGGRRAVLSIAAVAALPLLVALWRTTRALSAALGLRALPAPARGLDRADTPRRALIASLHFALLLACSTPILVVAQPFIPQLPTIAVFGALVVVLGIVLWQSAGSLYGHARASAEVYSMALSQHDRVREGEAEIAATVRRVSQMLPGLGDPVPVVLESASQASGRTLRELDLRGRTGATVLSLTHADGRTVDGVPIGSQLLAAGDVLVLAGTEGAVAAARSLLLGASAPAPAAAASSSAAIPATATPT